MPSKFAAKIVRLNPSLNELKKREKRERWLLIFRCNMLLIVLCDIHIPYTLDFLLLIKVYSSKCKWMTKLQVLFQNSFKILLVPPEETACLAYFIQLFRMRQNESEACSVENRRIITEEIFMNKSWIIMAENSYKKLLRQIQIRKLAVFCNFFWKWCWIMEWWCKLCESK